MSCEKTISNGINFNEIEGFSQCRLHNVAAIVCAKAWLTLPSDIPDFVLFISAICLCQDKSGILRTRFYEQLALNFATVLHHIEIEGAFSLEDFRNVNGSQPGSMPVGCPQ